MTTTKIITKREERLNAIRSNLFLWLWYRPHKKLLSGWIWEHIIQKVPPLYQLFFFVESCCPYHWCRTVSIDGWTTRRWCDKCGDYFDMG
jgi:hypothetical protein